MSASDAHARGLCGECNDSGYRNWRELRAYDAASEWIEASRSRRSLPAPVPEHCSACPVCVVCQVECREHSESQLTECAVELAEIGDDVLPTRYRAWWRAPVAGEWVALRSCARCGRYSRTVRDRETECGTCREKGA